MKKILLAGLIGSALLPLPASAQDSETYSPWFFRLGAAELQNLHGLDSMLAGQPVPGTALNYHHVYSVMLEVGYSFTRDFSAVLSVGYPPAISSYGSGTLTGVGKIVSTTYGPSALTIQYQPFHDGMLRPYVGAGAAYSIIFSTHDGALQNARLTNDLSPEIEAGADIMLQDNLGLFVETKRAWLETHATGTFLGLPYSGHANYGPWVYATGVTFHL